MYRAQAQSEITTPWGTLVEVTSMPTNGTFWSIENNVPPSPFDPFPELPLYTDGAGNYYYSNPDFHHWGRRHGSHGGRMTADDSPPDPPGGTGSGGSTNDPSPTYSAIGNFNEYYDFSLSITNSATEAYVSVMNTLPGFSYTVLTNYDLSTTNWGVFYTFTATNLISPCPPVALGAGNLFFNAELLAGLGGQSLWVCTNVTKEQMVSWLMGTNPVTVTNITYTGCGLARGIFTNGAMVGSMPGYPGLPFDGGIILSTGWITHALGSNNDDGGNGWVIGESETVSPSDLFPFCGENSDSDLINLVDGSEIRDAAVLEFDMVATNSFQLSFDYVFASEEYPEYLGTFNDTFAIFVSTNYASGQWQNGLSNDIALVPGTNLTISVDSINGGCTIDAFTGEMVEATNPQYYIDNHDPNPDDTSLSPSFAAVPVYNLQYDGFTVQLTAQTNIVAGITNHIKIAIGDCNDYIYDSAVFLKAPIPATVSCSDL